MHKVSTEKLAFYVKTLVTIATYTKKLESASNAIRMWCRFLLVPNLALVTILICLRTSRTGWWIASEFFFYTCSRRHSMVTFRPFVHNSSIVVVWKCFSFKFVFYFILEMLEICTRILFAQYLCTVWYENNNFYIYIWMYTINFKKCRLTFVYF